MRVITLADSKGARQININHRLETTRPAPEPLRLVHHCDKTGSMMLSRSPMTRRPPAPAILYLTDRSDRGESAMILGMHRQGIAVTVLARMDSPHVQNLQTAGVAVRGVSWHKKLDRSLLRQIREIIANEHINIVHALNSRATLHMVLATRPLHRLGKSPKLIAYLGVTGNVAWWSPLSWMRFLNPRIDRIICVAEAVRRYLLDDVRWLGRKLDPAKVITIYKGHELEWYQQHALDTGEFGLPEGAMVVAVASRLRPRKGLVELVRALALTDPKRAIHLLFIGHTGNDAMRAAMARLAHPERVHFTGFRPDAPAIMAASDVCCLPVLRGEGLSRAVIEGMACGIAPLVTNVGGNAELVVDGESGLVVAAGDEPALAAALEYLYDHPDRRRSMGRAARERIDRHFRSRDTVRKTLDLYQQVLSG